MSGNCFQICGGTVSKNRVGGTVLSGNCLDSLPDHVVNIGVSREMLEHADLIEMDPLPYSGHEIIYLISFLIKYIVLSHVKS